MPNPNYDIEKFESLLESGIFVDELHAAYFEIKNSKIRYDAFMGRWEISERPSDIMNGRTISFEEALDEVDPETQTQLLFHLDLFR